MKNPTTSALSGVEIRPAHTGDERELVELIRELQDHQHSMFDRMKPSDEIGKWYLEHLRENCVRHDGAILIANLHNKPIGYAVGLGDVVQDEADEQPYHYAYIGKLMVTEAAGGQGLGQRLVNACEDVARKTGAQWLRISVLAQNQDAVKLYRNAGFNDHFIQFEKPFASQ